MVRCAKCGRHLTHPESMIRGLGPICYGKTYTYRRLLKEGKSREEIIEWEKDNKAEMKSLARKVVNDYLYKKNFSPKNIKIRMKKVKNKIDPNQMTLDSYFVLDPVVVENPETNNKGEYIAKLREELHKITGSAAVNSHENQDRALDLIIEIRKMEGQ